MLGVITMLGLILFLVFICFLGWLLYNLFQEYKNYFQNKFQRKFWHVQIVAAWILTGLLFAPLTWEPLSFLELFLGSLIPIFFILSFYIYFSFKYGIANAIAVVSLNILPALWIIWLVVSIVFTMKGIRDSRR